MKRGRFITLEGGEGAGKSTQSSLLIQALAERGIRAIATREVGGAPGAEAIRELWLSKPQGYWDPMTEVFLIMAARREHLHKTILPALEAGTWVISDRFVDSTRAYQGIGLDLGVDRIDALYREVAGSFWPDKTLLFDLPVETGLARMHSRSGACDRYEAQSVAFHETLRAAFLKLAAAEPTRFAVLDASQTVEAVAQAAMKQVSGLIETN